MFDVIVSLIALTVAIAVRPWRALGHHGPPWPWMAWWSLLPLTWGADRYVDIAIVQPLSGTPLLVLMAGWPLAVLGLVPVTLMTGMLAHLTWDEALHRYVWLGLVPATLMMGIGALIRRLLPNHLFVYILGRGFFGALLAGTLAGWGSIALHGVTPGLDVGELMIGRWLSAWGDAFLTGMISSIFVAFFPHWLATYSDRIYLPVKRPSDPPGR